MKNQHVSEEEIEDQLRSLRDVPERKPEDAQFSRSVFLQRAAALKTGSRTILPVTKPVRSRHTGWNTLFQRKESQKMSFIPTLIIVAALLFGGTGATVAAAQSAMPDDLLYPVKLVTEDIAVGLSTSPEGKVNAQLKKLERRSSEVNQELEEEGDVEEELTDSLVEQLDEAIEETGNLDRENQMEALLRIQTHMQLVLQEKIDRGQPIQAQNNIQNLLDKVQARITALEEYLSNPDDGAKFNMGHWKADVEKHNKNKNKGGEGEVPEMEGTPTPTLEPTLEGTLTGNGKGNNGKNKNKTPVPGN